MERGETAWSKVTVRARRVKVSRDAKCEDEPDANTQGRSVLREEVLPPPDRDSVVV